MSALTCGDTYDIERAISMEDNDQLRAYATQIRDSMSTTEKRVARRIDRIVAMRQHIEDEAAALKHELKELRYKLSDV